MISKQPKKFIKGFKEGYGGNYVKTRKKPEDNDDNTIAEILERFEKEVPSRDVWEIYEDFEIWLVYTRPKDGIMNLQPYYTISKNGWRIDPVSFREDEARYFSMKEPIYKRKSDNKKHDESLMYGLFMTSYEEEFINVCDMVMLANIKRPIIDARDRDEVGVRYAGDLLKGEINKNDILEIVDCSLQSGKSLSVEYVEIRKNRNEDMAVFFTFDNESDCTPIYFVKVSDSKRQEYEELLETIKKEIES